MAKKTWWQKQQEKAHTEELPDQVSPANPNAEKNPTNPTHSVGSGNVGETGEHGDLGSNAA